MDAPTNAKPGDITDRNLALELVRVTEAAALAASHWVGLGRKNEADGAAVEAMRKAFDVVAIDGTVVIGEGEMDEAPMLYIGEQVGTYFEAATRAALVLAEYRAPYRGRSTPVNAWWGSFDLAVSLFSGQPADPPSADFIMRNSMDAQEVAVGWWPGEPRYARAAFYAYAHPAPDSFAQGTLDPAEARWEKDLGLYVLDWQDVCASDDPHAYALDFLQSAFSHACLVCEWDRDLVATALGTPPPVR